MARTQNLSMSPHAGARLRQDKPAHDASARFVKNQRGRRESAIENC